MAFSTRRGRPATPKAHDDRDLGTPELRLKHALRLTAEPIDLCLESGFITEAQHRSGLHLRWLYTLRYGAPSLTTRYADPMLTRDLADDADWRAMREREYHEASRLLKAHRRYECVMQLAIFNERPPFLTQHLRARARECLRLSQQLSDARAELVDGLELLTQLWRTPARAAAQASHIAVFS